jgi:tRNA dimethylallyltransferase
MADGFLAEVEHLLADPRGLSRTARQALGYRELASHIEDDVPLDDALDLAVRRTRRFARRQASWFRRDPRIRWLHAADDPGTLLGALDAEVAAADGAGGAGQTDPHTGRRRAD